MKVRTLEHGDLDGAVALQRACFPPPFPLEGLWTAHHLRNHLKLFPQGQFVATENGHVIGTASNLVISEHSWRRHDSWVATTGGLDLSAHDPNGSTLYGADISVHPDHRGQGVARALYEARFDLVHRLGLVRFGTACRIPDWQRWALGNPTKTKEQYCALVAEGSIVDRTLTPLLRLGLRLVTVVEGHMDDPESGNAAAVLEWVP